jgi:CBS domain-containing protein
MTLLVSDAMTKGVRSVPPDLTLLDLERVLVETRIGAAPVVRAGELVGVVSRTDVLRRLLAAQELRDYAELEQQRTISGLDVPLHELLPAAETKLDPGVEAQLRLLRVSDIMSERAVTVAADASLEEAGRVMLAEQVHRVIVVDGRKPVGILSTFDIVRYFCGPVP